MFILAKFNMGEEGERAKDRVPSDLLESLFYG